MATKVKEAVKQETTTVVVEEKKELAVVQPEADESDAKELDAASSMEDFFSENAGAGLNNLKAGDFATPFLTIIQKGSPQASRANSKHIPGAAAGIILNTVTNELHDGDAGIDFIPCGYQKQLVRWKSRDSGGGLVCHYKDGDPALAKLKRNERGQLIFPDCDDIIVDTAYHFGLLMTETGFPDYAVISMASTQLKASRNWNTVMRKVMKKSEKTGRVYNPPSFSHAYHLTTVPQTKDAYDWFGWSILIGEEIQDINIAKMALEFSKQIESGEVRVSAPPQDDLSDADDSVGADGVPF